MANFGVAFESELIIVPVLNKIDLKNADPDSVADQMHKVFGTRKTDILKVCFSLFFIFSMNFVKLPFLLLVKVLYCEQYYHLPIANQFAFGKLRRIFI